MRSRSRLVRAVLFENRKAGCFIQGCFGSLALDPQSAGGNRLFIHYRRQISYKRTGALAIGKPPIESQIPFLLPLCLLAAEHVRIETTLRFPIAAVFVA